MWWSHGAGPGADGGRLTRFSGWIRPWTPLTRGLLLFALFNVVVVNAVLRLTQGRLRLDAPREDFAREQVTLWHTAKFLLMQTTGGDSWLPMTRAWEYLQTGASRSVYDAVWQDQLLKFQYPLTSLFAIDVVQRLLPGDTVRWAPLNLASWLAVWGTAVLVALIFRDACREHLGLSVLRGASRGDELARMAIAFVLTLTFYPVVRAFTLGQIQPWITFLFAAMVWLAMRDQPLAAGVMGGLMVLIKPQMGLLVVWAALRRRWRFAAAQVAVVAVGAAAAIAVYGVRQNLDYVSFLSYLSRHGEAYYSNQSVNGLVNRLLQNGDNAGIYTPSYAPFRWPVYLSTIASSAVLLAFAAFWRRREHADEPTTDLLIAGLSITMASPIAWGAHYGILMPIFAALLPAMVRWPVLGGASLAYLGVAFVLSGNLFYFTRSFADTPFTIAQSYVFVAAVMVLVALYLVRGAASREGAGERPAVEGASRSDSTLVAARP